MTYRYIATALLAAVACMAPARTLRADGVTDTYSLIAAAGFYTENSSTQTADEFMGHGSYRHISQVYDNTMGRYVFAFDIHVGYKDGARSITDGDKGALVDRQRNEIKCMSSQPDMVAADGETITYRWKFCLPEGMKTTSEFCHIHQIKGMGSGDNVAHPVFTLTCRSSSSSRRVLQVINVPYEGSRNVVLGQIDLALLLGRWVEAVETVTVGHHGSYKLTLTDVATGNNLININEADIEVWRDTTDRSTMRGKWGIYRSLGSDLALASQLRSERVLFADFETARGTSGIVDVTTDFENDTPAYDLLGRPATRGILIKNKRITTHK